MPDVLWSDGTGEAQARVTVASRRARGRWALVLAGTAVLCSIPALVAALPVPASAVTAQQLQRRMMSSAPVAYQGYAQSDVNLDLPDLPDLSNVTSLLDGTTNLYTWYRSPTRWRADVLTTAGEEDTYQTAGGTFVWSYAGNLLTQVTGSEPVRLPRAADLLPPELARRLLGYAGHAAKLSRLPSERIAGIDAAGLRVVPAGQPTTIGAVEMWADPRTGLPVQVEIFGRGAQSPALVSRFLDVSLARPGLSTVTPRLAPGAGFTQTNERYVAGILNGFGPVLPDRLAGLRRVASPVGLADVAAYGTGFGRFVVLPLPLRIGEEAMTKASSAGAAITIRGGTAELITTPLLTTLLASPPGGPVYLLTGAVPASLLERAATSLLETP